MNKIKFQETTEYLKQQFDEGRSIHEIVYNLRTEVRSYMNAYKTAVLRGNRREDKLEEKLKTIKLAWDQFQEADEDEEKTEAWNQLGQVLSKEIWEI